MDTPHKADDIELTSNYVGQDRIPPPAYRHAAPSAPWPWIDVRDSINQSQLESEAPAVPKDCDHTECDGTCWKNYPESRFPNWTENQVKKSKIHAAIHDYDHREKCIIHKLDVNKQGIFCDANKFYMEDDEGLLGKEWDRFKNDNPGNIRVRVLFVENMTGPALRMLGGKYNIEPFFFSSSLNWIPTHFQEDPQPGIGDHITITLPFIQSLDESLAPALRSGQEQEVKSRSHNILGPKRNDMQAPLRLASNRLQSFQDRQLPDPVDAKLLVLDLLSVHLIRNIAGNVIISYHANSQLPTTKAAYLHERIRFAGQSVYWEKMLEDADDPVLLLLIFIWHALYAWDEALQYLYKHICTLETEAIKTLSMQLTEELHMIRARLLHYSSLLAEFKEIVLFLLDTPNPALTAEQRKTSDDYLQRECNTIFGEIERLDNGRLMLDKRLHNVINLVFSSVNLTDSKSMQKMTKATIEDSTAMKQITYLTMVFFPAAFVATIFSMNVKEITGGGPSGSNSTLGQYFITTCAIGAATTWIIVAFQSKELIDKDMSLWQSLVWPIYVIYYGIKKAWFPERSKAKADSEAATPKPNVAALR